MTSASGEHPQKGTKSGGTDWKDRTCEVEGHVRERQVT